jgi:hypothetical protein
MPTLEICMNNDLSTLISGKRVAIVGPSPHLVGKDIGGIIDEYDVVCRINDIIPLPHMREDYGSKIDILFHNMGTVWMEGLKEKIKTGDTRLFWDSLKLVVCPTIKSVGEQHDYLGWSDDHVSDVVGNFESVNDSNIPFYWIGVKDYKTLWSTVGVEPNCGILAIVMSLCYNVQELFVTGFSFYKQGTKETDVYCEGHWPAAAPRSDNFSGGHQQHRQLQLFKNICNNDKRVFVDSYMNELLELNHENVIDL